jgi:hypothetical protein
MGDMPKRSENGVEYLGHITHKKMKPYFRNAWFSEMPGSHYI